MVELASAASVVPVKCTCSTYMVPACSQSCSVSLPAPLCCLTFHAQIALICHVPKALQEATQAFNIKEWVEAVCKAANGEVVEETEELVKIVGKGDREKELFPLKMRDAAQAAGFAYIKSKGLIPEEDSDDYIPVSQGGRTSGPLGLGGCGASCWLQGAVDVWCGVTMCGLWGVWMDW